MWIPNYPNAEAQTSGDSLQAHWLESLRSRWPIRWIWLEREWLWRLYHPIPSNCNYIPLCNQQPKVLSCFVTGLCAKFWFVFGWTKDRGLCCVATVQPYWALFPMPGLHFLPTKHLSDTITVWFWLPTIDYLTIKNVFFSQWLQQKCPAISRTLR